MFRLITFGLSGDLGCRTSWLVVLIPWDAISSASNVGYGMLSEPCRMAWRIFALIQPPTLIFRPLFIPESSRALSFVTSEEWSIGTSLPHMKWCQTFMFWYRSFKGKFPCSPLIMVHLITPQYISVLISSILADSANRSTSSSPYRVYWSCSSWFMVPTSYQTYFSLTNTAWVRLLFHAFV